ncbi:hypothetical protein B7R22_17880 [Subtercola boreus]|uniref:Uncharacterized protein n=1 Tax=Subtercola boreus TaxID=120213 RepID=A0A3E0VQW8_9MICO|nr:hypothetical protein B7R22_17880 [Subtercola boreus]
MALKAWIDLFVEFLTIKHGLAFAMTSDASDFGALHTYFLDRLVPACTQLLEDGIDAGLLRTDVEGALLLRAVGNLCIKASTTLTTKPPPWCMCSSTARQSDRCPNRRDLHAHRVAGLS